MAERARHKRFSGALPQSTRNPPDAILRAKEFMSEAYDDGYEDITGVDIVPAVLDNMKQLNASRRPGIKYEQAAC